MVPSAYPNVADKSSSTCVIHSPLPASDNGEVSLDSDHPLSTFWSHTINDATLSKNLSNMIKNKKIWKNTWQWASSKSHLLEAIRLFWQCHSENTHTFRQILVELSLEPADELLTQHFLNNDLKLFRVYSQPCFLNSHLQRTETYLGWGYCY